MNAIECYHVKERGKRIRKWEFVWIFSFWNPWLIKWLWETTKNSWLVSGERQKEKQVSDEKMRRGFLEREWERHFKAESGGGRRNEVILCDRNFIQHFSSSFSSSFRVNFVSNLVQGYNTWNGVISLTISQCSFPFLVRLLSLLKHFIVNGNFLKWSHGTQMEIILLNFLPWTQKINLNSSTF